MTSATQDILKQALNLKPVDRAELIEKLFQSFDQIPDDSIDSRWAEEAESRLDAYDAGKISADSAKAVFERINKKRIRLLEKKHRQGYLKHPSHKDEFST